MSKKQITIIFASIIILLGMKVSSASAATYYISNSGNDSNSGTSESQPWQTIAKVNSSTFQPGDSILFKKGDTWREQLTVPSSGAEGIPITFGAYGTGDKPKVSGADLITGWTDNSSNIWYASVSTQPNIVLFDGAIGTLKEGVGLLKNQYDWYWDSNVLYVYSASDPSSSFMNPGIEVGSINKCLIIGPNKNHITIDDFEVYGWNGSRGVEIAGNHNVVIQNCLVHRGNGNGIEAQNSDYVTILNNTVVGRANPLSTDGIRLAGFSSGANCDHAIIDGNVCYGWSDVGIRFVGYDAISSPATNGIIKNNTCHDNGGGIYVHRSVNLLVQGNNCYDNKNIVCPEAELSGLSIQSVSDSIFERNILSGNGWHGCQLWGGSLATNGPSDNNIIRYNIFSNNGAFNNAKYDTGFASVGQNNFVNNNQVYSNLMFDNFRKGVKISGTNVVGSNQLYNNVISNNIGDGIYSANCSGWTIKNNIMSGNGQYALNAINSTDITHSNNFYYKPAGDLVAYNGMTYANATIRRDFEATAFAVDPIFADPENGNFRLQSTSPAIDAGAGVGLTADSEGTLIPQGSAPDIGAFEWKAAAPTYSSADLNQDHSIDSIDLDILKTDFLKLTANLSNPRSDINADGQCTVRDLGILMSGWGS